MPELHPLSGQPLQVGRRPASVTMKAQVLGADGVQMGTRLLASADSPVHGNLKQAVVRADETSTVLLPLDGRRMMRVIRTPAADKLDASASFWSAANGLRSMHWAVTGPGG